MMAAMLPLARPGLRARHLAAVAAPSPRPACSHESPDVVILEVVERTLYEGLPGW